MEVYVGTSEEIADYRKRMLGKGQEVKPQQLKTAGVNSREEKEIAGKKAKKRHPLHHKGWAAEDEKYLVEHYHARGDGSKNSKRLADNRKVAKKLGRKLRGCKIHYYRLTRGDRSNQGLVQQG